MKTKNILSALALVTYLLIGSSFVNSKNVNIVAEPKIEDEPFAKYLSYFERTSLPYEANIEKINYYQSLSPLLHKNRSKVKIIKGKENSRFLPENYTKYFSRMGTPVITPLDRFYVDEQIIAVVYKSEMPFFSKTYALKMMFYDLNGNILPMRTKDQHSRNDSFPLSTNHQKQAESFSIDKNGIVTINSFEKIWEKDVTKVGYSNENKISEYVAKGTRVYKINKKCILEKVKIDLEKC